MSVFSSRQEKVEFLNRIAKKWQKIWEEEHFYEPEVDWNRPKFFATFPYPYMNGRMHVGHVLTSARVDFIVRFKLLQGYNVLWPQGWHCTGGPIVAASIRIKEGDEKWIRYLKGLGVSDEEIEKFRDPKYWIEYFTRKWNEDFKSLGYAIDWRREFYTTSYNPPYEKFIHWQYRKLKEKGLVFKGEYPCVWCPKENKVVGDHDRKDEYVGIRPQRVVLIKFRDEQGRIYPCCTYRPETTWGVTNIWINPDADYVLVEVDGELWYFSKDRLAELKGQRNVGKVIEEVRGRDLILRYVISPVDGRKVPILPAEFVDPTVGTGIVMSVPAHAPYDYRALQDLKENKELRDMFGIPDNIVEKIEMIPLIKVEGYGDYPAKEICEKMEIKSQKEREKLDKATEEIYKKEYHLGVLREIFGQWAGKKVCEAKEEIIKYMVERNWAEEYYILPSPVECRCGALCHVAIVRDQWFLKYSDPEWKEKAHEALERMKIFPKEAKENIHRLIDWLEDRPCAHHKEKTIGETLPWDPNWVVESLSDSTIYMAYYIVAKYLQHPEKYNIDVSKIDDEFFDYVFLGKGDPDKIARKIGTSPEIIRKMREEFEYWYPVDIRNSAYELMYNHLLFYIFHHVAIFEERFWPKGIAVNGWVTLKGEKMSKSKGNVINACDAVKRWSPDALRLGIATVANSSLTNVDIDPEVIEQMIDRLVEWYYFAIENYGKGRSWRRPVDDWFESVIYDTMKKFEEAAERMDFGDAVQVGYFDLQKAWRWYIRRCGIPNKDVLKKFIEMQTIMLAPFAPHIASEIWFQIKGEYLFKEKVWPDEYKVIDEYLLAEDTAYRTFYDAIEVKKLLEKKGVSPKKVRIVVAAEWKYKVAEIIKSVDGRNAVKEVMKEEEFRKKGKEVAKIVERIVKEELYKKFAPRDVEYMFLRDLRDLIKKELKIDEVEVVYEEETESLQGKVPLPGKPAIIFE